MLHVIKIIYRLFKYKEEWRKQFREIKIRKQQKAKIRKIDPESERLILFLIPGSDYLTGKENITGGLISIVSLVQETIKIFEGTNTQTLCVTNYNEHLIYKNTSFENQIEILSIRVIENYFKNVKRLVLHIPELFVKDFVANQKINKWINKIQNVHINVLNQNIQLMPEVDIIHILGSRFSNCTITTAHKKYCNLELRLMYNLPFHQLSVWISPENYINLAYNKKENLILFSPDNKVLSLKTIEYLHINLKGYHFQIISGLTYEAYKKLISKAKFVITTGEGLDAYFIETYFSGGIAFAVKNLNFFDEKYLELPCLFNDDETIKDQIIKLILEFDNPVNYRSLNLRVYNILSQDYSYQTYQENLKKFYNQEYTYA